MKIRKSIFTKLFVTMLIAGTVVILFVGAFFRYFFMPRNREMFLNNVKQYTDYIVKDIGAPPDTKRAGAIAKETGFDIFIEGKNLTWSSTGRLLAIKKSHKIHRMDDGSIHWERGSFLYKKKYGAYQYLFSTLRHDPGEVRDLHLILLLFFLTLILSICYLLIRNILMPVRRLTAGMREVAGGNLDYVVTARSGDELGDLARSFNEMRERIGTMLRTREQLLLDMSHELRSPLTRIKVALEYLEDTGTRRDIADDIIEMERMVTEILETERLDRSGGKLKLEEVELPAIAREVIGELHIEPDSITINSETAGRVLADRDLVKTVLKNILENSRKYSKESKSPITVTTREKSGTVIMEVRDSGIGIPREDLPLVFEPFYRVDHSRSRKTGGYGLGLSLCKKIVEAHGGSIEIESTPGEGTLVRIKMAAAR